MKKIIFAILLMIFCGLNFYAQSELTQEEYDFYSYFLRKDAALNRYTTTEEIEGRLKSALDKLPEDLVSDFLEKNKKSVRIEDKLKGIKFYDQSDPTWNVYNKEKNEIHFVFQKKQYVSRVAFSNDRKYALVCYTSSTEGLPYGDAVLIWLVRKQNDWKEKKRFLVWEY